MSNNVYQKLQNARVMLQNKKLKKSGKNKLAGFEYFELADFLPSVNAIFDEMKMCSCFSIENDTATLTIVNAEVPEDKIVFICPIAELDLEGCNAIQALGGVNTYCKRYLYLNALEIVEADMFDPTAGQAEPKEQKPQAQAKPPKAKPFPPRQASKNPDEDIINGLAGISDLENLEIYYYENVEQVKDIKAFNVAVNRRKKELVNE